MAVKYKRLEFKSRDNELVSMPWFVLLFMIDRRKVSFNVNEGHRTKARQQELINQYGLYDAVHNPTGAAPVSDNAPHIRTGRFDHAVDFDNAIAVILEARKLGVVLNRPITTEDWHVEADAEDLMLFYKKNRRRVFRYIWADRVKAKIKLQKKEVRKEVRFLKRLQKQLRKIQSKKN